MKKFKYQKISKSKKLRYIDNYYKKKLYIIFLPGFMSDVEGKKPQSFRQFAIKRKFGFLALEYSGHGKSTGKFTRGNISIWTKNVKFLIKKTILSLKLLGQNERLFVNLHCNLNDESHNLS